MLLAIERACCVELRLGPTAIAPSFIVPFIVFVSLFAPSLNSYWTALLLGLAIDLTSPRGTEGMIIAGPHALGLLGASYLVVSLRTVINRNTLALVVFSIVAAAFAGLVTVAIFTFRSWYTPQIAWFAGEQLSQRIFSALYTGASAALLSLILFPAHGLFRFQDPYNRRSSFRP